MSYIWTYLCLNKSKVKVLKIMCRFGTAEGKMRKIGLSLLTMAAEKEENDFLPHRS